jgi:hypothetical protein
VATRAAVTKNYRRFLNVKATENMSGATDCMNRVRERRSEITGYWNCKLLKLERTYTSVKERIFRQALQWSCKSLIAFSKMSSVHRERVFLITCASERHWLWKPIYFVTEVLSHFLHFTTEVVCSHQVECFCHYSGCMKNFRFSEKLRI